MSDVVVTYELKADESSLGKASKKLEDMVNKALGGSLGGGKSSANKESKSDSKTTGLLGDIVKGVALGNFLWSAFADFVSPILKMLKLVLALLFIPLIPILVPVLKGLASLFGILLPGQQDLAKKTGGEEGAGVQAGSTLGAVGGGVIGGVLGSALGPAGIAAGAVLGASLGVAFVNFSGELLAALLLGVAGITIAFATFFIDLGKGLGKFVFDLGVGFGKFLVNLGAEFDKGVASAGTFLTGIGKWLWDSVITPMGNAIKQGVDSFLATNWLEILSYGISKLWKFIIDGINGVIGMLKSIQLPTFKLSFTPFPKISWSSFSPFSGLSSVATPESVTSAITNFENKPKAQPQQSMNITNNLRVDAGVDKTAAQKLFDDFLRSQARTLRNSTSYIGGIIQ